MLFGTYQTITGDDKDIITADRYYNPELGFSPIWAVPLDNMKDAITSVMCATPNYPCIFYMIETDDYIRVDKVKHYQNMKNNVYTGDRENKIDSNNYSSIISNDCDNMHSEFLLNPAKLTHENIINVFPAIVSADPASLRKMIRRLLEYCIKVDTYCVNEISRLAVEYAEIIPIVPDVDKKALIQCLKAQGASDAFIERMAVSYRSRYVFESIVLPLLCTIYCNTDDNLVLDAGIFETVIHNLDEIINLRNEFTKWSRDDCSLEEYDRIINSMRNNIIDDINIREKLILGEKINPNDECPCGSGRKFKKCHGLYV